MAKNDPKDRPDDYVGYGHPPKQHRFGPGNKANPHGRKGKPRKTDFLDERQRVLIDGKWRWMTRDQLIDITLYKAVIADQNVAAAKLLEARRQARFAKQTGRDEDEVSPEEQAALLRAAQRRFGQTTEVESTPEQDDDDMPGVEPLR